MRIFKKLNNRHKWLAITNQGGTNDYSVSVIKQFFLIDDIDLQYFSINEKAYNRSKVMDIDIWQRIQSASMDDNKSDEIDCTPTLKRLLMNNRINNGAEVPDWFYIAYPDVVEWFLDDMPAIEKIFENKMQSYITNGKLDIIFFRDLIDYYKSKYNRDLECGI